MTFLTGDANGDYSVDFFDIVQLLGFKYNTGQPATFAEGDLNGDGVVDFFDLTEVLASNYNAGPYWTPPLATGPLPTASGAIPASASIAPAALPPTPSLVIFQSPVQVPGLFMKALAKQKKHLFA
jgi:hypothetical protein